MIKIENCEVVGWEHAIRGMRNPLNSWNKSDSIFSKSNHDGTFSGFDTCRNDLPPCACANFEVLHEDNWTGLLYELGLNDLDLMQRLRAAGTDHRKFMRMITVYVDITAPLYWWKEHDQYKVGTTTNSCSTMHKIQDKEFTLEDFSCEHLERLPRHFANDYEAFYNQDVYLESTDLLNRIIGVLNIARNMYLETKDKRYWWQMIQLLPSSYNQKRTVMLNYEVLVNMYKSRKGHKLDEWREFCKWIESLPYSELITGKVAEKEE